MEDSFSERKKKVKFAVNDSNKNDDKYKKISEQLTDLIKRINENFDFKTFEKEKMLSVEMVIN